jgi:hypothetical protein
MSRLLAVLVSLCVAAGLLSVTPSLAASPTQSLYRVDRSTRPVVESLLARGVVVSQRLGTTSLAFGDESLPGILEQLGCDHALLDSDTRGRDYYLVPANAAPRGSLHEPLRLLDVVEGTAVISTPRGQTDRLHALGVHFAKLFRTPLRLGPRQPRRWEPSRLASPTTLIESLVRRVATETLTTHVWTLESFGTRNAEKQGGRRAAAWIAKQFRSYGIEQVEIQSWSPQFAGNVVATLPGAVSADEVFVLGGHYDSIAFGQDFEPGADDNASGTAAVLECARLLAPHRFAATLVFIAFGAEEYGLIGSEVYAGQAALSGQSILGMINLDMLGYRAGRDALNLDLISNKSSTWLRDAVHDVVASHVPDLPIIDSQLLRGSSDHQSFWRNGFDAVFFFEDTRNPSPFIHTIDDVVGTSYIDNELHTLCTQAAVATLVTLAGGSEVPVALQSFSLQRQPDAVRLTWRLSEPARDALAGIGVERAFEAGGPYERRAALLAPHETEFVDLVPPAEDVWYRLALQQRDGTNSFTHPVLAAAGPQRTGLESVRRGGDDGMIEIRFRVAGSSERMHLGIYDVRGRLVRALVDERLNAGAHVRAWSQRDGDGRSVGRGVYLVHLRGTNVRATRKVTVHAR